MTTATSGKSVGAIAYPAAFFAAAILTLSWLMVTRTDISVWQDFRRDVVVRDSYKPDQIADIRFFDSSQ